MYWHRILYNLPKVTEDYMTPEPEIMALTTLPSIKIRTLPKFFLRIPFSKVYCQFLNLNLIL